MKLSPEEEELWEKIEPYLIGCHLADDAPQEIKEAERRFRELGWENLDQ